MATGAGILGISNYLESKREEQRIAVLNTIMIKIDRWLDNQEKALVSSATEVIDKWVN